MAKCPECGGRVTPVNMISSWASPAINCRWCRSLVAVPTVLRATIAFVAIALGSAVSVYFTFSFWDTGEPRYLLGLLTLLALVPLTLLLEAAAPLRTLVYRDRREWRVEPDAEVAAER